MLDPHDDTDAPSGSTDGAQMESTSSPVPREQGSVGPQGLWGKEELGSWCERAHIVISARNCDTYPVPCRAPADRQPHSHTLDMVQEQQQRPK